MFWRLAAVGDPWPFMLFRCKRIPLPHDSQQRARLHDERHAMCSLPHLDMSALLDAADSSASASWMRTSTAEAAAHNLAQWCAIVSKQCSRHDCPGPCRRQGAPGLG